jgi:transposase
VMDRLVLSGVAWERMAPLIIGRPDQKGFSTARDNRMFVEGVLRIVHAGSSLRDLPGTFGDWSSVFQRFSRWSIGSTLLQITVARDTDGVRGKSAPTAASRERRGLQARLFCEPL